MHIGDYLSYIGLAFDASCDSAYDSQWMVPAFMMHVGIVMGPIAPVTLSAVP
jgi:hypothetical protein